ncbi:unnamed protein product [Tilletia controversa]|nr:unnamed protein product [Tilletia controversa]CAD6921011.1 unnamed protein product [Tilletia controversa]
MLRSPRPTDPTISLICKYILAAGFSTTEYAVTLHALGNLSTCSATPHRTTTASTPTLKSSRVRPTLLVALPVRSVNLEIGTKSPRRISCA